MGEAILTSRRGLLPTPAEIGAAAAGHTHTAAQVGALGINGNAASASKLATGRSIAINLASNSAQRFDGTADVSPGVSGILPIANGGTGHSSFVINSLLVPASATKLGQIGIPDVESVLCQQPNTTPYWKPMANLMSALGINPESHSVIFGSYYGTGTNTVESSPATITFSFAPTIFILTASIYIGNNNFEYYQIAPNHLLYLPGISTSFTEYKMANDRKNYIKKSTDGKSISWYGGAGNPIWYNNNYMYYYMVI